MEAWIQSIALALLSSLAQGAVAFALLGMITKLAPSMSARLRYHLSLSALSILLIGFIAAWWQSFAALKGSTAMGGFTIIYIERALRATTVKSSGGLPGILQAIYPWLAAGYVSGLGFMLLRLLGGMQQLMSLKYKGRMEVSPGINTLMATLQQKMNIDAHVGLYLSIKARVPMVIGFLKPLILLPAATLTQLSMAQLESILLHELAHIKRHDYLINILQTIAETLLFFNPFAWLISGIVRREREYCCDDMVLEHSSDPLPYAQALAAVADNDNWSAFTIAASNKYHLLNRIKRIMETKKNPLSYSRIAAAILIIAGISLSTAWLSPTFAHPGDNKPTAKTSTKTTTPNETAMQTGASEENKLVEQLLNDGMVDEIQGFTVEKKQDKLIINGKEQSSEVAGKYLKGLKSDELRVQVFSLNERFRMHPDAGLIQNLMPATFSSPCVQKSSKPGC